MNFLISILFIILMLISNPVSADVVSSNISSRLTRLIEQVDQLEKKQQEIMASQNKIINEIKNLKIQARR